MQARNQNTLFALSLEKKMGKIPALSPSLKRIKKNIIDVFYRSQNSLQFGVGKIRHKWTELLYIFFLKFVFKLAL